jgi:Raf kinase inhibitor-like YbhB/YbcL family protein
MLHLRHLRPSTDASETVKMRVSLILLLIMFAAGCAKQPAAPARDAARTSTPQSTAPVFKLISSAFKDGDPIPRQYTCSGVNVSPPLEWSDVPKTAKTLAIIADDPDAPAGTWVHWVVYNLPADTMGIVENLPQDENLKGGGFQGKNDFEKIGYGGPCPPSGTHRYYFRIYALDGDLPLKAGVTKTDVEKAMDGHILGQTQLMGTYKK